MRHATSLDGLREDDYKVRVSGGRTYGQVSTGHFLSANTVLHRMLRTANEASAPLLPKSRAEFHPQVISSDTSNKTLRRMIFSGIDSVLMFSFDDTFFQIYNG